MKTAAILIVQDDFLAAERLRLLLVNAGYTVVGVAGRTKGAIDLCQAASSGPGDR